MCSCVTSFFFFFKLGLCVFNFPHLLNFPQNCFPQNCFYQNLFCFSYFYRGRNLFLTFVVLRGSCFLDSLFPLILCCVCFSVYSLIRLSLSIRDKKGEKDVFKTYVDHRGSCFLDSLFPLILCCTCLLFTL